MITKFNLEGFFNAPSCQVDLIGEAEFRRDSFFEGNIYAPDSRVLEYKLGGNIKKNQRLDNLVFLRFPVIVNPSRLFIFRLHKPSTDSFEGKYSGEWGTVHYNSSMLKFEDYQEFMNNVFDVGDIDIRGSAEISLHKK